jgi:hypothetical protein
MTHLPAKSKAVFKLVPDHDALLGLPVDGDDIYEPFGNWLDGQLQELVDKWLPLAAPNASRRERVVRAGR